MAQASLHLAVALHTALACQVDLWATLDLIAGNYLGGDFDKKEN
jgi:hypothetical protein